MARSWPHVGQWWEANTTSVRSPNSSMASEMYRDHACGSRTRAPRMVRMLCRTWVAFSAMHSARRCGRWMCISAGASEPGASWNSIRTPSTVSSWPVEVISTVGGISVTVPVDVVRPRPAPT